MCCLLLFFGVVVVEEGELTVKSTCHVTPPPPPGLFFLSNAVKRTSYLFNSLILLTLSFLLHLDGHQTLILPPLPLLHFPCCFSLHSKTQPFTSSSRHLPMCHPYTPNTQTCHSEIHHEAVKLFLLMPCWLIIPYIYKYAPIKFTLQEHV